MPKAIAIPTPMPIPIPKLSTNRPALRGRPKPRLLAVVDYGVDRSGKNCREPPIIVLRSSSCGDGSVTSPTGSQRTESSLRLTSPSDETFRLYAAGTWIETQHGAAEVQFKVEPRASHDENFLQCMRTREKPVLDGQTAYKAMVPIAMSVESCRSGQMLYFDEQKQKVTSRPIRKA